jgi:hypothetical protein
MRRDTFVYRQSAMHCAVNRVYRRWVAQYMGRLDEFRCLTHFFRWISRKDDYRRILDTQKLQLLKRLFRLGDRPNKGPEGQLRIQATEMKLKVAGLKAIKPGW